MIDDNYHVHLRWIIDHSILAGGGQGVDDHLLQAALLSDNLETFPGYEHCPSWFLRLLSLFQNTQVYRLIKCQLSCLSMQQVVGFDLYVWVHMHSQWNMPMFCLTQIISQPWGVQKLPILEEMTLTHYILMSVIFWSHLTPHTCLTMPKCSISVSYTHLTLPTKRIV